MHCLLMGHTLSGLDFLELQVTLFNLKFDYEVVSLEPSTSVYNIFAYIRIDESI